MSHIFISYARKDKQFVDQIAQALASDGSDVWIDDRIPKGEDWEQEIYRNIDETEAFLFMVSAYSVASEMCNKEIGHAVKNGKRLRQSRRSAPRLPPEQEPRRSKRPRPKPRTPTCIEAFPRS